MPLVKDIFEFMKAHNIELPQAVELPMEFSYVPKPITIYKTLFKRTYSAVYFCEKVLKLYYDNGPDSVNIGPTAVHDISCVLASLHPIRRLESTRAKIVRGSKEKGLLWYLPDLALSYDVHCDPKMFSPNAFMLQYISVVIFIIREIHQYNEGVEWADHNLTTAIIDRSIGVEHAKSLTVDLVESSPLFKEKPHLILKEFFGRDLGEHGDLLLKSAVEKGQASTLLK